MANRHICTNKQRKQHQRYAELVVVYTLLTHKGDFDLTYDNLLFLINRIEMMDSSLMAIEPENTKLMINEFLNS